MKKQRLKKLLKNLLIIVALGICYLCFFLKFGFGIPCIFKKVTGYKCPGCGMTRAIAQLWKGNVEQALYYNKLVLNVLPITCLYLLYRAVRYINGNDEGFYIWEYAVLSVLLIVTIGYGILRNTIL